jgi:hypothetical protein
LVALRRAHPPPARHRPTPDAVCTDHLRDIGCTLIILHSSDAGMNLYKSLGFEGTSELRLKLR